MSFHEGSKWQELLEDLRRRKELRQAPEQKRQPKELPPLERYERELTSYEVSHLLWEYQAHTLLANDTRRWFVHEDNTYEDMDSPHPYKEGGYAAYNAVELMHMIFNLGYPVPYITKFGRGEYGCLLEHKSTVTDALGDYLILLLKSKKL